MNGAAGFVQNWAEAERRHDGGRQYSHLVLRVVTLVALLRCLVTEKVHGIVHGNCESGSVVALAVARLPFEPRRGVFVSIVTGIFLWMEPNFHTGNFLEWMKLNFHTGTFGMDGT